MLRRLPDPLRLAAVALIAAACGVVLLLPGVPTLLSAPAAILLVLVLPGYALMRALFTRRLEVTEQALMTLVFSVGITIATGLGINVLPSGLTIQAWGSVLAVVGVIACGIAIVRHGWEADAEAPPVDPAADPAADPAVDPAAPAQSVTGTEAATDVAPPASSGSRIPRAQLAMMGLAVVIVVLALGVARLGVTAQPHDPFTQFWMLPDPSGLTVSVGITNEEGADTTYRLLLRMDGNTVQTIPGVEVAESATWQQDLPLPIHDMDPHSVTALIYRPGDTLPYRETHSTVTLTPAPSGSPSSTAVPAAGASPSSGGAQASPSQAP